MAAQFKIEIRHLKAAGLDDTTIREILEILEQESMEKTAERNRRSQANYRQRQRENKS